MEVEDAFEKWLSDWVSRNPAGELSPKTVWFVASRWGYGQNADRIAALEAERDAYKAEAKLLEHKVITCGVAASHSDADLTRTGAYAEKWNSQQAEQVRKLRAERDALRADAERYRWLDDNRRTEVWSHAMSDVEKASAETLSDAIDAAIAAKEPANGQG